jgi:hypothetical protein
MYSTLQKNEAKEIRNAKKGRNEETSKPTKEKHR